MAATTSVAPNGDLRARGQHATNGTRPAAPPASTPPAAANKEALSTLETLMSDQNLPPIPGAQPGAQSGLAMKLMREFRSLRWMVDPYSSLRLVCILVSTWAVVQGVASVFGFHNPLSNLLFISYRLPFETVLENDPELAAKVAAGQLSLDSPDLVRYGKGLLDLAFIGFYVIVFSLLRQGLMLWVFQPFSKQYEPTDIQKQLRIMEQCYAITYWGSFAIFGVWVMSFQESWWYQFEHFWLRYPHWLMRPELKTYYLLQGSYWLQQALVMLLQLEAPRKDYYELVAHHLVTLWLIGWSYGINLTMIGTSVFVAMDIPDTFLGTSKLMNYLDIRHLFQGPVVVSFFLVWTYFRIYLSTLTLVSVYKDFWLIPKQHMVFKPLTGAWLAPFMRWQIFAPLFLLLLLNIFWYVLILRILIRISRGVYLDEREVDAPPPLIVRSDRSKSESPAPGTKTSSPSLSSS